MSMTNEMISAKDFMEKRVFNKDEIKSQLLEAAKRLTAETILKAFNYESFWEVLNDDNGDLVTITMCRSKDWDPDFPNEPVGEVEKCKALFCTKLFPMNEYEEWLHSYGWEFDFSQQDTKIWINIVSL